MASAPSTGWARARRRSSSTRSSASGGKSGSSASPAVAARCQTGSSASSGDGPEVAGPEEDREAHPCVSDSAATSSASGASGASDTSGATTADLVVRGAAPALKATEISGSLVVRSLDELPILAVVAACAHGTTLVRQAEELRVKESDRIATTCAMLRAFGVSCEERPDGFAVEGSSGAPLGAGAQVDAAGDHRIAMAGAIAALRAAGPAHIGDADNVATSYPGFVDALAHLGAAIAKV